MSRAFRQTLERLALFVVGLILGCLLVSDLGSTALENEREDSWIAGYRRGQGDYQRLLRKTHVSAVSALPTESGG